MIDYDSLTLDELMELQDIVDKKVQAGQKAAFNLKVDKHEADQKNLECLQAECNHLNSSIEYKTIHKRHDYRDDYYDVRYRKCKDCGYESE